MTGTETGLKLFIEVVVGEVGLKLRRHCFFQDFCKKWKVGDGTEIIEDIGV